MHVMIFVLLAFLEPLLQKTFIQHILNFREVWLKQ